MRHLIFAGLIALASAPMASAAPPPRMAIGSFNQLAQPLPLPYTASADADRDVAAALSRAKRANKLLLIDMGGNWCLDCRLLAGTMETAPLKGWMARHYEVVTVDVGRMDKNLQIPARYGIVGRLKGVPALLVINPRTGKVLNAGRETALSDARSANPQALANWLASWTR